MLYECSCGMRWIFAWFVKTIEILGQTISNSYRVGTVHLCGNKTIYKTLLLYTVFIGFMWALLWAQENKSYIKNIW